ncbi:MAG: hypothetical protein ACI8RZ_007457 [Myxococcota bacterium]|jgi:hypothetical protein
MSRLALLLALLVLPMSASADTWRVDNVDLPETLGELLIIGFSITATSGSSSVQFASKTAQLDANGNTPWVTGKDESGLSYRARMSKGSLEVEMTESDRSGSVTKVTATLNNAEGERLVSAALTETAERAQEQRAVVR